MTPRVLEFLSFAVAPFSRVAIRPLSLVRPANICMWHAGRVGSTVVGDLLNQHTRIHWRGELLETYSRRHEGAAHKSAAWRGAKRLILTSMLRPGTKAHGLEVKHWHLERLAVEIPEALSFLKEIGYNKHIVLERKNYLRIIVSCAAANETRTYHVKSDESKEPSVEVELSAGGILRGLDTYARFYAAIKSALGSNFLWLTYEDDVQTDPMIAYQKALAFCGLEYWPATVHLRRTNPAKLKEIVKNFDEIHERLRGTPYEPMLAD